VREWERIGRDLQEEWLRAWRLAVVGKKERMERQRADLDRVAPLRPLIRQYYEGDASPIAAYLRTYQLSQDDQDTLARFFEGAFTPERPERGAPKSNERAAAGWALRFYRDWKEHNKRLGVDDRGCADDMKTEAARFIVHDILSHAYGLNEEIVRANMDRSKNRQN
jgi:hypothetical protein